MDKKTITDGSTYSRKNQKESADIQQEIYFALRLSMRLVCRWPETPQSLFFIHVFISNFSDGPSVWLLGTLENLSLIFLYFFKCRGKQYLIHKGITERWQGILEEAGLKEYIGSISHGIYNKRLIDDVRQALYVSKISGYEYA